MTPEALADAIEGSLEIYRGPRSKNYAAMVAVLREKPKLYRSRMSYGEMHDYIRDHGPEAFIKLPYEPPDDPLARLSEGMRLGRELKAKVDDQGRITSTPKPKPEPPKREPETSPIAAGCGALDFEGLDRSLKP